MKIIFFVHIFFEKSPFCRGLRIVDKFTLFFTSVTNLGYKVILYNNFI